MFARLFLLMFSFMIGVLSADPLPDPGLTITRIDRSAVRVRFTTQGSWTLEWSGNFRSWYPYASGKAGAHCLTVPIIYEQAFFRVDLGGPKSVCEDDDDHHDGNGHHKKKKKKK